LLDKNLVKNTSIYTIGRLIPQLAGFFLLPIYTKYLTPSDYGIISAMQVLSSVLAIFFSLAIQGSIYRLYFDYKKESDKRDYLGTVTISLVIISISVLILLFLFKNLVGKVYSDISFYPFYAYAILTAFFSVYRMIPLIYFQINEKPNQFISLSIFHFILTAGFILLFIVGQKSGAIGMLKGQLISGLIVLPLFVYINLKIINFNFQYKIFKSCLAYSLPTIPHVIAGWVLSASDRIFIERYLTLADLGIYSIGHKIGSAMFLLSGAFRKAYSPYYYKIALSKNQNEAKGKLFEFNRDFFSIMIFGSFILALFSKEIISFFLDNRYIDAYKIIPAIVLSNVIIIGTGLINLSITFEKKTLQVMYMFSFTALINVILNYSLIPSYGVFGAVYATLLSSALYFLLNYWYSKKCYFIPIDWKRFIFLITLFTTIVLLFQLNTFQSQYMISIKIILVIGLLIYFKKYILDVKNEIQKISV